MTSTVAPKVLDGADPHDPRDPRGLRSGAPLLDAWLRASATGSGDAARMSIPGHKQRADLTGAVVAGDIPLYAGLDTIKHADALLAEAEQRAARLWGADWCRFSVAGSTHGNQALALAVGRPGDEVVVSRTLHRSLLLGLVLAGLRPVWVRPEVDPARIAIDTGSTSAASTGLSTAIGNAAFILETGDPAAAIGSPALPI